MAIFGIGHAQVRLRQNRFAAREFSATPVNIEKQPIEGEGPVELDVLEGNCEFTLPYGNAVVGVVGAVRPVRQERAEARGHKASAVTAFVLSRVTAPGHILGLQPRDENHAHLLHRLEREWLLPAETDP